MFLTIIIAAGLGLIPANIAKGKGYSFGLWWFYGWMLFIVAIIHVNFLPDKNSPSQSLFAADELKKYKELEKEGIITEEEFQEKREQLLKLM